MATPDQDAEGLQRLKRTRWLIAGGAVSLLLPLFGAVYLRWSEANAVKGPSGRADMFERREGQKLVPSHSVVPTSAVDGRSAAGGDSLGMIQAVDDLKPKAPPPPPPAPAPQPAYVPPPAPIEPPRPAPRQLVMPKLQPTKGFHNFKAGIGAPTAMPQAGAGMPPGMSGDAMKAMQDPQVQKYLQSQGR